MHTASDSSPIPPLPEERRERFVLRFGLRTLLAAMVFASVGAYWGAGWRRDQIQFVKERQVVEELAQFGATARYFDHGGVRFLEFKPIGEPAGNDDLRRLGDLKSVLHIDLRQTMIDDAGLPSLYGQTQLRVLKLSPLRISAEAVAELTSRLPYTDVRPSDFYPAASLAPLNRLARDGVVHVSTSGPGFRTIGRGPETRIAHVMRFGIGRVGLTDANLPDLFLVWPNLTQISVDTAPGITDAAVPKLARYPQLIHIDIAGSAMSEAGARSLDKMLPNTSVRWRELGGRYVRGAGKEYYTGQRDDE